MVAALWAAVGEKFVAEGSVPAVSAPAEVVAAASAQVAARDPDAPWVAVEPADAAVPSLQRC